MYYWILITIHGFIKLPTTLNGYCLPLHNTISYASIHFVTYSWGNKDSLTIASICLYASRSGYLTTANPP